MNGIRNTVLVSYSTRKQQKQLEDYIYQKTGRKTDLGDIGYDGELTILNISLDLSKITRTNITGAIHFPGRKFRGDIEEFIKWHEHISTLSPAEAEAEMRKRPLRSVNKERARQ